MVPSLSWEAETGLHCLNLYGLCPLRYLPALHLFPLLFLGYQAAKDEQPDDTALPLCWPGSHPKLLHPRLDLNPLARVGIQKASQVLIMI